MNDSGEWHAKSFKEEHNHELVESCGQNKHMYSHQHIDPATRDLIKHLRQNNVSLTRVNSVTSNMYGSTTKVPFSKRKLKIVCYQIASRNIKIILPRH